MQIMIFDHKFLHCEFCSDEIISSFHVMLPMVNRKFKGKIGYVPACGDCLVVYMAELEDTNRGNEDEESWKKEAEDTDSDPS